MGSVESSTLESVEALSTSLAEIERKLTSIEDVHLHHERTICHDDTVVISGKRIKCRPGVNLVVGPILGTITLTSFRVFVETDNLTEISLVIFHLDEHNTRGRFHSIEHRSASAYTPTAWTIRGLTAGTRYAVYFGGISPAETLMKYASFSTLPEDPRDLRILAVGQDRAGFVAPGQTHMWDRVYSMQLPNLSNPAELSTPTPTTAHLILHTGDFVRVDDLLVSRGAQLLALLSREGTPESEWKALLDELETSLLGRYRSAFGGEGVIGTVLRTSGNLFLTGVSESGVEAAQLLGVRDAGPGVTGRAEKEAADRKAAEEENQRKRDEERVMRKYGIKSAPKAAAPASKATDQGGDEEGRESDDEDFDDSSTGLLTGVEELVHKEIKSGERAFRNNSESQSQLRRMVLSLLLRLARRVHWLYVRQLWDEEFAPLLTEDLRKEETHREILRLRRMLWAKKDQQRTIREAMRRLEDQAGADVNAMLQIKACAVGVADEVAEVEGALDQVASAGLASDSSVECSPHAVLDLGGTLIVLVEVAWGWLTREGDVHEATKTNVAIDAEIWEAIEEALLVRRDGSPSDKSKTAMMAKVLYEWESEATRRNSQQLSVAEGDKDAHAEGVAAREVEDKLCTVIVVSAAPLLPTGAPPHLKPRPELPFSLAGEDVRDLITSLARWQTGDLKRVAAVVEGATGFAASGWILPPSPESEDPDSTTVWEERSKVRLVTVGALVSPPTIGMSVMSRHRMLPHELRYHPMMEAAATVGSGSGLESVPFSCVLQVEEGGQLGTTSFWELRPLPPDGSPGVGAGLETVLHSSVQFSTGERTATSEQVIVGPIVGAVTCTSARILFECASTTTVNISVVDQLSGVETVVSRRVTAGEAAVVKVDGLLPDRPYAVYATSDDVVVADGPSESELPAVFTTQRIPGNASKSSVGERRAIQATRVDQREVGSGGDRAEGSGAEDALDKRFQSLKEQNRNRVRIAIIGSCREPSAAELFPVDFGRQIADSAAGSRDLANSTDARLAEAHREKINAGIQLVRQLSMMAKDPWSPLACTIRVGGATDLQGGSEGGVKGAASTLSNAEKDFSRYSMSDSAVSRCRECVQDAYRSSWSAGSLIRELVSSGSQLAASDGTWDLCRAMNMGGFPSITRLERDLSPFIVSKLLEAVESSRAHYEDALWPPSDLSVTSSFTPLHVQLLGEGQVLVASLQLGPVTESFTTPNYGLLKREHWDALESLLFPVVSSSSSPNNLQFPQPHIFLLVSPIPLIPDQWVSHLAPSQLGIHFSSRDIVQLLDLLTRWTEFESHRAGARDRDVKEREVHLVCGGSARSFITTVEGYVDQNRDGERDREGRSESRSKGLQKANSTSNMAPNVTFRQTCVGDLFGPSYGQVGSLPPPPPVHLHAPGSMVRGGRGIQYTVTHKYMDSEQPLCAVIEIELTRRAPSSLDKTQSRRTGLSTMRSEEELTSLRTKFVSFDQLETVYKCEEWAKAWPADVIETLHQVARSISAYRGGSMTGSGLANRGPSDTDILCNAVHTLLDADNVRGAIRESQKLLVEGRYGFITESSSDKEVCSALFLFLRAVRRRLETGVADSILLVQPSSVTVVHAWGVFRDLLDTRINKPPANTTATSENGDVDSSSVDLRPELMSPDLCLHLLSRDFSLLFRFVEYCFSFSLLLHHVATGDDDGLYY